LIIIASLWRLLFFTITEFDEALVKKLQESVKVCEFFLEFRFKSGVTISIEK